MKSLLPRPILATLALVLAISLLPCASRANVYATNLKLNGSTNSPSIGAGESVTISYLLNEPASAGATIRILSGTNVVRTMTVAAGNPGTLRGLNLLFWNGRNDANAPVAGGDYSFSVTAAATGYSTWTQISSDTNAGNQLTRAWGIAVNQNTNSFYYGRVFVANAYPGTGDPLGFHKLNADGSPAEEGVLSNGGYAWTGPPYYESPFRVKVGADDRFYALDLSGNGVVLSWDQQISTNSLLNVMRDDNNPGSALLSGFCVTGNGTNRQLYMCDWNSAGVGINRWNIQTDGTLAANDKGTQVVAVGGDLADSCYDVGVDLSNKIYALCAPSLASQYKYMRFPAYTNTALLTAEWKVDNTSAPSDPTAIAVNATGTYVAAARSQMKAILILNAATGATVATVSSNAYSHNAVAWDNVGNVYSCFDTNGTGSIWQAWSPPGANQATTYGLETMHVAAPPTITSIVPSGTNFVLTFTGPASALPSAFGILSGSLPAGITNIVTNALITGGSGVFQAVVPLDGPSQFYRVRQ